MKWRHTTLRIAVRSFHAQHCGAAHDTPDAYILRLGRCAAWVRNEVALTQALSNLHAFVLHNRVPLTPSALAAVAYVRMLATLAHNTGRGGPFFFHANIATQPDARS